MTYELKNRLGVLKKEFESGQAKLQQIDAQQLRLRDTLLRISGAIQVLEELLKEENAESNEPSHLINGSASGTADT